MSIAKKSIVFLVTVLLSISVPVAFAQNTAPDQVVKTVLQDVIGDIQKASKSSGWNQNAAVNLIEKKVAPYFDFTKMTSLAVGRPWRQATPDQKAALTREFHRLIVRTYANTLMSYQNETITIAPLSDAEAAKSPTIVRGQVNRSKGDPIKIDISVQKAGNSWTVYDVTVAGVSIVMNFRDTFTTQVNQNGIDGLIKMLVDKNNSNDSKK